MDKIKYIIKKTGYGILFILKFLLKHIYNIMFFILPLFTILILEELREPYLKGFFELGAGYVFRKYALTYVVVLSMQYMFSKIFYKRIIGIYFTNILLFVLGYACTIMIIITGDPLLPAHLFQAKNLGEITSFIEFPWKPYMIRAIIFLVLLLVLYTVFHFFFAPKGKQSIKNRILSTVISIVCFLSVFYAIGINTYVRENVFPKIGLQVSGYYTISDYKKNGMVLTFLSHTSDLIVETPEDYNYDNVKKIINKYPEIKSGFVNHKTSVKNANVIAIQSESLWDPTKMQNITLSDDPLKYTRKLSEEGEMGALLSPVFGCNTCVPEFEFITGYSSYFLKAGAYPYSQYIHRDTPTLASSYKENGYVTYALHTYDKYFYGRNGAYKLMGFDKFVGKSDIENPEIKGTYVSDDEVTRQIIKMYEEKGNSPMFLYAITMQNHGNYLKQRYESYDIEVNSDVLENNDLTGLRDAVQGVRDADKALYDLANYFREADEPTIIVLYGDHLPFLGLNSSTYYDTGFLKSDNLGENPQMYETPYIVWANFDISQLELQDRVSPAHLGMETIKLSGIEKTYWHHRFFDLFYNKYSALQHSLLCDENGEYIKNSDSELMNEYKLIQHDALSGNKYTFEGN